MLEFPTTINIEQLESLREQSEIEEFSEFEKALTEQLLWEIINSLEPLEE